MNFADRLFSMPVVAKAAGTSVENIRNYVHRGVLLYPGSEPRAGYPREFPLYGVYEIALLNYFQRTGLTLEAAKAVWRAMIWLQQEHEAKVGIEATAAPPRALPEVLNGDLTNGKLLLATLQAEKTGRIGVFKVVVREVQWGDLVGLRRGFQTLLPGIEGEPPLQTFIFDLNRFIVTVNRDLVG